jgi:hypothetical protein
MYCMKINLTIRSLGGDLGGNELGDPINELNP